MTTTISNPLATKTVSDAMSRGVLSCQEETPLATIATMMAEHRVHSVIVTDLDGVGETAWGIVNDLDVMRAAQDGFDQRTAGDTAGTEMLRIGPGAPLERAAQLMAEHEVAHLVVVERGKPIGVLSALDVTEVLAVSG